LVDGESLYEDALDLIKAYWYCKNERNW
jgi:hypothetical protein